MRKEIFPNQRKLKLIKEEMILFKYSRGEENTYKIDLANEYGNVSATFNVVDLSLYDIGDSRANSFEKKE